jgi:FKBP-type peptidyl-prolyl cis-trans isomerase 2
MAFKDGDFIGIDYSMRGAPDNELIITTDEESAKSGGIYDKEAHYGPALVILGSSSVIKGLDSALHSMSLNEQKTFTFKPEEAFGVRDEGRVRVVPLAEFSRREIRPYVGMRVSMDDTPVVVKSINSGRVVVDANHPYAGREVTCEVKVAAIFASDKERMEALGRAYGISPTKIEINERSTALSFDDSVKKDADYLIGKANLVAAIFTYLKGIDKVRVEEEYERPKESAPENKA